MYSCSKCGTVYDAPKEAMDKIRSMVDANGIGEVLLRCKCGGTHLVGGELDVDPDFGQAIMMYGRNPECYHLENLETFDVVVK